MLIYLDMCSIHRPLDDKAQFRILVEGEAVLSIVALCQSGQAELMSSDALVYEVGRNPNAVRKAFGAMTMKTKPLAEVSHQAIAVLARELGAADAIRFINQFTTGYGDYTSERDILFADQTLDQIIGVIKKTCPEDGAVSNHAEGERGD